MMVTATELAHKCKRILDWVAHEGEIMEVQRRGHTVAVLQSRVGVTRAEWVRLLQGRRFNAKDSKELKAVIESACKVIGYAGG
jgi:uncharacterized membrane protein